METSGGKKVTVEVGKNDRGGKDSRKGEGKGKVFVKKIRKGNEGLFQVTF